MKFAWIMAEGKVWDLKKQFITTALESGIEHVVDFTDVEKIKKLGNLTLIPDIKEADIIMVGRNTEGDGTLELPDDLSKSNDLETASNLKRNGRIVAAYVKLVVKSTNN